MKAKARVEFRYSDEGTAEKVCQLLEVDNRVAPRRLKLRTYREENRVITTLEHQKLGTFFSTIDDLIFSEKLIADLVEGLK
jgi:hypothetical protein